MRTVTLLATVCTALLSMSAHAQELAPVAFTYHSAARDDVITAGPDGTSAAVIRELAIGIQRSFQDQIVAASERERQLRSHIGVQTAIYKIGQYVGGGGAMLFGFNDQGRNAAYAGTVASLFTLADNIFSTKDKVAERAACLNVTNQFNAIVNAPSTWIAQADNPDFQQRFIGVYQAFLTSSQQVLDHSGCDIPLTNLKAVLQARVNVPAALR